MEDPPAPDVPYPSRHGQSYARIREGRERLKTLRLVSRRFCLSASARLFRCIRATISRSISDDARPLRRLLDLCSSPQAPLVRHLHVGYDYYDYPGTGEWVPGSRYRLYAEDASRLLPICLSKLSHLQALHVFGPLSSFLTASVVAEPTRLFTDAVMSTLRYVRLPCLTELDLHLPVTHEFGELCTEHLTASQIPISDVMRQLRRLEVAVTDYAEFRIFPPREASPSALRGVYGNADFVSSLTKLIELSTSLESLSICGSYELNLDALKLNDDVRLKSLRLCKVAMTAETLVRILEQSSSSLRHLNIADLDSDDWAEVLSKLRACPRTLQWSVSPTYRPGGDTYYL